jgi:hypothetical protein
MDKKYPTFWYKWVVSIQAAGTALFGQIGRGNKYAPSLSRNLRGFYPEERMKSSIISKAGKR